jgi:segregation and condensation protein A
MSLLGPILVKIDSFEGPMELLIELIKKREMPINDLSISTLTQDFLANIQNLKQNKIELTAEFLRTASLLLEIKSQMLLPQPENKDPRNALVKELEDYQMYKNSLDRFKELEYIEHKFMKRQRFDKLEKKKEGSLADIINSYTSILKKRKFKEKNKRLDELTKKLNSSNFTIDDRIVHLKSFDLPREVDDLFGSIDDLEEMIVTFSALLELVRIQFFSIYFSEDGKTLFIRPKENENGDDPFDQK